MNPKVAIIILNWNGWEDTIECLESLYRITYPNYDVIVVDNGSEDESIEEIKEFCEGKIKVKSKFFEYSGENKPIKIIEYTRGEAEAGGGKKREIVDLPSNRKHIIVKNERNYGFAEGNNIAMRYALKALNPDYVLLLNNDTVVDRAFLGELVKVAENDERVGIAGPKIYYYDYNGRKDVIWFAGGKIQWWAGLGIHNGEREIDYGQHNATFEPAYITGCAMLIRREALEECGMFDSKFFGYYEDIDLSLRMKKQKWGLKYVPTARIWHKVGQSSGGDSYSPFVVYYLTRNRILFVRKHYSRLKYSIFFSIFLTYKHISRCVRLIVMVRSYKSLKSFYKGIWDGIWNK
jgi:GT2 family glycosyltransferase